MGAGGGAGGAGGGTQSGPYLPENTQTQQQQIASGQMDFGNSAQGTPPTQPNTGTGWAGPPNASVSRWRPQPTGQFPTTGQMSWNPYPQPRPQQPPWMRPGMGRYNQGMTGRPAGYGSPGAYLHGGTPGSQTSPYGRIYGPGNQTLGQQLQGRFGMGADQFRPTPSDRWNQVRGDFRRHPGGPGGPFDYNQGQGRIQPYAPQPPWMRPDTGRERYRNEMPPRGGSSFRLPPQRYMGGSQIPPPPANLMDRGFIGPNVNRPQTRGLKQQYGPDRLPPQMRGFGLGAAGLGGLFNRPMTGRRAGFR